MKTSFFYKIHKKNSRSIFVFIQSKSTVIITSPSFDFEQNDSIDSSSTVFLQANYRRNKSDPYKSNSTDNLLSSTINDLSMSNNAHNETRRKSSRKIKQIIEEKKPSSSSTAARKKKAWYNVSTNYLSLSLSLSLSQRSTKPIIE
jgi:hypothetical protein